MSRPHHSFPLAAALACGLALFAGCKPGTPQTPPAEPGEESAAPASASAAAPSPTPTPEPTPAPTPEPAANRSASVVVLCYHQFEESARDAMILKPSDFEAQLQRIKEEGFTVIPMADFLAWKRGEKSIPEKSCLITIDDGYRSVKEAGWPILQKFGYPFTLFVYTDYVKGGPRSGGKSLSWQELAEMRDAGVDIQSHSVSHSDLRSKKGKTPEQYKAFLDKELGESKRILESELGIAVKTIAYPYGNNSEEVRAATLAAGYEIGFTVYGQRVTLDSPNDAVGRYAIDSKNPKVFESAMKMSGGGASSVYAATAPAAGSSAPAGAAAPARGALLTSPAEGESVPDPKPLITADLTPLGEVDPASVEMRLSGFGVVPAKFDPATKKVSYQVTQKIREKSCTVFLSATAGGKKTSARWTFQVGPAQPAQAAPQPAP